MRFSLAKKALVALAGLAAMTAFSVSSANAGIIITIGDSPLLSSSQIQRYIAEAYAAGEEGEEEHERTFRHSYHHPGGHRNCQSAETGKQQVCPRPTSQEVDSSGLPSEWSCFAIRPGVFYCDAPIFGAGSDAGDGGYAGAGDFNDEDEIAVMGCGAGDAGSSAGLLALLGAAGLWLMRRRLTSR